MGFLKMVVSWFIANSLADRSFLIGALECVFQNIFLAIKIYFLANAEVTWKKERIPGGNKVSSKSGAY